MTSVEADIVADVSDADQHARSGVPVLWITGLSGVGKSTLARELCARLAAEGDQVELIDGDAVRLERDGPDSAQRHDLASRHRRACRLAALAHASACRGAPVIVATISLFHDVQRWNRVSNARYAEVLLRAPLSVLQRHCPARYDRSGPASAREIWGVDLVPQYPERAELVLDQDFAAGTLHAHTHRALALWRSLCGTGRAPR